MFRCYIFLRKPEGRNKRQIKTSLFDAKKGKDKETFFVGLVFMIMPRETSKSLVSNKNKPLHIKEFIGCDICSLKTFTQENSQKGKCIRHTKDLFRKALTMIIQEMLSDDKEHLI